MLTDPAATDPMVFCRSQSTAGVALLTRRFGIRGYATSVHTACASGGQAIGTALKLIRRGSVDCALAGGFDSMISPVGIGGFCLLSAVSADNDTPQRASRPFDATRNGFVLGEGAGFLVLEEWESARRRGARIYAELAGDGNSLSSYRITDSPPDGDGPIQSMRAGAQRCRRAAGGHRLHQCARHVDADERQQRGAAIHAVFGAGANDVSVSSTKSTMGHLIAAAGAVEVVVCALAIHHGEMPVNANYVDPDPDCDLNSSSGGPQQRRVRMALSNSFGFGGSNSCIVLRHPDEVDRLTHAAQADVIRSAHLHHRHRRRLRLGHAPDAILDAVQAGRSAIAPIEQWDTTGWPVRVAAEVRRLQSARAGRRPQAAQADPPHRHVRHLRGEPGHRRVRHSFAYRDALHPDARRSSPTAAGSTSAPAAARTTRSTSIFR